MNSNEYLLVQAASECNEVAHRITKALHFGLDEVQTGQPLTNKERIVEEYAQLVSVMGTLDHLGLITLNSDIFKEAHREKRNRVYLYMDYAKSLGTVKD
jgi:hypothetical protein